MRRIRFLRLRSLSSRCCFMSSSLLGFRPFYPKLRFPKYASQQILALGQRLFAVVTREHFASDTATQPRPTSRRLNQVHLVHDVEGVAGVAATSGFWEVFAGQELHVHWKTDVLVAPVKTFEPTIEVAFVVVLNLQRVINDLLNSFHPTIPLCSASPNALYSSLPVRGL